jgi:phosphoribosylformylglycinamidine (FGAM) synthase-like enzyme
MANPWLTVPLADYEGHMRSANVEQLDTLSDLFAKALASVHAASVAILGIAGGNGLEHIDTALTKRIIGIDVNAGYLNAVQERYRDLPGLELHRIDLSKEHIHLEPVQLVHAALVFEHAGVGESLDNALSLVAVGGTLSIVLQLPSQTESDVSPTAFSTIQNLKPNFTLIDPQRLVTALETHGLTLKEQLEHPLPAGKALWMGILNRH